MDQLHMLEILVAMYREDRKARSDNNHTYDDAVVKAWDELANYEAKLPPDDRTFRFGKLTTNGLMYFEFVVTFNPRTTHPNESQTT